MVTSESHAAFHVRVKPCSSVRPAQGMPYTCVQSCTEQKLTQGRASCLLVVLCCVHQWPHGQHRVPLNSFLIECIDRLRITRYPVFLELYLPGHLLNSVLSKKQTLLYVCLSEF